MTDEQFPEAPDPDSPITGASPTIPVNFEYQPTPADDTIPAELDALIELPTLPQDRRGVPGLRTPFPLINAVPPMLAEDSFVQRMMPGFDEVLAPIISTLDNFPAYLDPHTAPLDMVEYIASWMFTTLDEEWTEQALRHAVATAVERSRWRGTSHGLEARLQPFDVSEITITENGSVAVSSTPTDPDSWPDPGEQIVTVAFTPLDPSPQGIERVTRVIRSLVPAHVQLEITVNPVVSAS